MIAKAILLRFPDFNAYASVQEISSRRKLKAASRRPSPPKPEAGASHWSTSGRALRCTWWMTRETATRAMFSQPLGREFLGRGTLGLVAKIATFA